MKLKILIKYAIFSIYIASQYATASIAIQAERFMRRPILHNFIQQMQCEDRWQPWASNTGQHAKPDVMAPPSTIRMHPATPPQNFILPGFGLPLDSFFLHDSVGTERCEDAIRVETSDLNGIPITYLSVAYCLGSKEKTFILGADRASIIHIYKYVDRALSCTYTALCPVRAEFGCHLNGHGGNHGREKEITINDKVAKAVDFDEEQYSLDFIKEYSRQAAHSMIATKEDPAHHSMVHHAPTHRTPTHHTPAHHGNAHEGHFCHYDIACHMANLATSPNGLSERLYRRGVSALLEQQTTISDRSSCASGKTSDGYTSAEESDASTSSHRGRSTKECAGQIMRVCGFSADFLITSWHKRDITSALEQGGIELANGRCIVDEKWREFALIKSLHDDFTGVIPYFFDNEKLFCAVYERKLNYSELLQSINSPKRKMDSSVETLDQTATINMEGRMVSYTEARSKGKKKLKVYGHSGS